MPPFRRGGLADGVLIAEETDLGDGLVLRDCVESSYFSVKIALFRSFNLARLAASGSTGCLTTFWWMASTSG